MPRKIFSFIFLLFSIFSLSGCNSSNGNNTPSGSSNVEISGPQPSVPTTLYTNLTYQPYTYTIRNEAIQNGEEVSLNVTGISNPVSQITSPTQDCNGHLPRLNEECNITFQIATTSAETNTTLNQTPVFHYRNESMNGAPIQTSIVKMPVAVGAYINFPIDETLPLSYFPTAENNWRLNTQFSLPPDSSNSSLQSNSCRGTKCVSVGEYRNTSDNHYHALTYYLNNEENWILGNINNTPTSSTAESLYGVDCVESHCVAVGQYLDTYYRPLVYISNDSGQSWSLPTYNLPTPLSTRDHVLSSISCTDSDHCVAVGSYNSSASEVHPLIYYTNDGGNRWDLSNYPTDSAPTEELNSISCTDNSCTAVGLYTPNDKQLLLAYYSTDSGERWYPSIVLPVLPSPTQSGALNGVSCVHNKCTAVGIIEDVDRAPAISYVSENHGQTWAASRVPPPNPFTNANEVAHQTLLLGILCQNTNCFAVGNTQNIATGSAPLIYLSTDNGNSWGNPLSVQAAGSPIAGIVSIG